MQQPGSGPLDVIIIGSGFAGLGMAIQLRKEGRRRFVILEKEADIGGTWLVNHYPGCACDVQSHLYSFSFEPNPDWTRSFSPQAEIRDYLHRCADKYDLRRDLRCNSEVTRAHFDEHAGQWQVITADGGEYRAPVLVSGMGGLSRPSIPDFPGLEDFRGHRFHSQQWDHDYDLAGKRVAVIGTGASAIQFVPQIAPDVAQLDLYQRTPPWVMPKPDGPISARKRRWFARWPWLQRLHRLAIYWFLEFRAGGFTRLPWLLRLGEPVARRHIARGIRDPELRRKVTPDYTIGCKRVLLANDYYPALDRDNVKVVTSGIARITAGGIVDREGIERPVDAIILGTGFAATEPLPRGVIQGKNGLDIVDAWAGTGPEAYLGTTVSGFPNLFILAGPNTGLGHSSMVFMLESQMQYVMQALSAMDRQGIDYVNLRYGVQRAYNDRLQATMAHTVWSTGGCKSWYMDASGKNVTLWPNYTWQFRLKTRRFRLEDYQAVRLDEQSAAAESATQGAAA